MSLAAEYLGRCHVDSDIIAHLPTLYDRAARYPQAQILELGVRSGNSTSALLAAAERVDGHVWSVDIDVPHVPGYWSETGRWTFLRADDLDPALVELLPAEVDVLFIDTLHTYEHTRAELDLYVPRVKPGGVILMHDTELDGPAHGLHGPHQFPVADAIDDYCRAAGIDWTNHPGCYGLAEIAVPSTVATA